MPDEMGQFRVDVEIESFSRPGARHIVHNALVDTGAELSWVPGVILESLGIPRVNVWHFRQANGEVIERWSGPANVRVAGRQAADEVVFGEPGDLVLLGCRSLEGLNLRVEVVTKQLVDAGPAPAAVAA